VSARERERIKTRLLTADKAQFDAFLRALDASFSRGVQGVTVSVLHGRPQQLATVVEAIAFLQGYQEARPSVAPALKYEIDVRYNNGDVVHGIFQEKAEAIRFLQTFA
jgi:hypothetical protein